MRMKYSRHHLHLVHEFTGWRLFVCRIDALNHLILPFSDHRNQTNTHICSLALLPLLPWLHLSRVHLCALLFGLKSADLIKIHPLNLHLHCVFFSLFFLRTAPPQSISCSLCCSPVPSRLVSPPPVHNSTLCHALKTQPATGAQPSDGWMVCVS